MVIEPAESMTNESPLRANARKPVVLTERGLLLIGGEQFPYPILADSIKVEPQRAGIRKHNKITLTILVGEVVMQTKAD